MIGQNAMPLAVGESREDGGLPKGELLTEADLVAEETLKLELVMTMPALVSLTNISKTKQELLIFKSLVIDAINLYIDESNAYSSLILKLNHKHTIFVIPKFNYFQIKSVCIFGTIVCHCIYPKTILQI